MGALIRLAALALSLGIAAAAQAAPKPSFVLQRGGVVAVALPPALLTDREVARHLASGLTTTFVLVVQQRDAKRRGAAQLEIRYDLWDEVWLVRRIDVEGAKELHRITSREALEKWWASPIRVFIATTNRASLGVTLSVLPFSAAEAEDVRQWIARSGSATDAAGNSPLIAALIGTTLNARPIRSWRWQEEVTFR